jgi:hypothetical protein
MKNCKALVWVAVRLIAGVGCLMIPAALTAAETGDSADIAKLLADTKAVAVQLRTDSSEMESFTRSKASWQSYATSLEAVRGHVNNAGQLLAKLKDAESTGSPWQKATVRRIEPLLQEMADNLRATIKHLSDNQSRVHFPEFTDYVKSNYLLATDLEALLRASIDYGNDKAKFELLSQK